MTTQNTIPPNVGSNLIGMLIDAGQASAAELRDRISNVRFAPSEIAVQKKCECIHFDFDGATYLGELRGRNRDLCITPGDGELPANRAIAGRVLMDGHATKIEPPAQAAQVKKPRP